MRRVVRTMVAGLALAAAVVVGTDEPAGAIVTVTTSGTTATVTLTGAESIGFACVGGVVSIGGKTGTPTIPCGSLTQVTVNGDTAPQTVDGTDLDAAVFAAKPKLIANLGDGADLLFETLQADTIDMGLGNDSFYLVRGAPNVSVNLGGGVDTVRFFGGAQAEIFAAASNNNVLTMNHQLGGALRTMTVTNAEDLEVTGREGADTIDLSGITVASTVDDASIFAGDGNDVVRGPQVKAFLQGGLGDNQITGGPGTDNIISEGNGDVINGGGGTNDRITDRNSPRSGRTITYTGGSHWYVMDFGQDDAVSRIRDAGAGRSLVTNSLSRPGQQLVPAGFSNVMVNLGANSAALGRGVADVVALGDNRDVFVNGDFDDDDILDVTIPTGSWTTLGTPATNYFIQPTAPGYRDIQVGNFGEVRIHGPWTNKNAGFVHRVTRDLMLRFASAATISNTAVALGDGVTTRPQVVAGLMNTDEYRGLDVDRTFVKYLNRKTDPGGRTYWIGSIRNGKALWRFRAQLFGSNEYFNKAGGTNAQYLDRVYEDVLGRKPDPSGRTFWTNKLNAGANRGSVALQFINAPEFRRFLVDEQFLRFLDRKPTSNEQALWVNVLQTSPTGEQQLIAALAAGTEYYNRT